MLLVLMAQVSLILLANQIVAHDEMVKNIRANLSFFGNPTLISSRPKQDIVEND